MTIWCHVTSYKQDISSSGRPIATNLVRVLTYGDSNLPIKSHDLVIMCSLEITWQIKNKTSPLWPNLWLPNLAGWYHIVREAHPWSHMTLSSRGDVKLFKKLKTSHLLFCSTYNYHTLLPISFSHDPLIS